MTVIDDMLVNIRSWAFEHVHVLSSVVSMFRVWRPRRLRTRPWSSKAQWQGARLNNSVQRS